MFLVVGGTLSLTWTPRLQLPRIFVHALISQSYGTRQYAVAQNSQKSGTLFSNQSFLSWHEWQTTLIFQNTLASILTALVVPLQVLPVQALARSRVLPLPIPIVKTVVRPACIAIKSGVEAKTLSPGPLLPPWQHPVRHPGGQQLKVYHPIRVGNVREIEKGKRSVGSVLLVQPSPNPAPERTNPRDHLQEGKQGVEARITRTDDQVTIAVSPVTGHRKSCVVIN